MLMANQSTASPKVRTSSKSVNSYATITQDATRVADDGIKMSFANLRVPAMTTDIHKHEGVNKAHHSFVDHGQGNRSPELAEIAGFTKPHQYPAVTFHALQEWEGYVTGINDTEFTASLIDITAGALYEKEEADIPIDEISENDVSKIQVGSIFRWVIGYERSATGTKKRVSHIVFRDLPAITKTDLGAGQKWARKIREAFGL